MTKEFAIALAKAQGEIKHAKLDSKNPHFKSDYASLEAHIDNIKPALAKHNLSLVQGVESKNNELWLMSRLIFNEEILETGIPLILSKNDMQGLGSAVSYARRYSVAALFNMGSDDDDGNKATENNFKKPSSGFKPKEQQVDPQSSAILPPQDYLPKPRNMALASYEIKSGPLAKYPNLGVIPENEARKWLLSYQTYKTKHPHDPVNAEAEKLSQAVKDFWGIE